MRRLLTCLAVAAVATAGCTGGGGDDTDTNTESFEPAPAPAVAIPLLADLEKPLRVGVIVSSTSARGEGAEFAALAAGARVAEFRLDDTDTDRLQLEVVDDRGTPEGAVAATEQLLNLGVAGIVYGSAGPHIDGALDVAAAADTAVLLPYDVRAGATGETAWRTGPSEQQVASAVSTLLAGRGQKAPLALTGEGVGSGLAALADPTRQVALAAGDALAGQVSTAADAVTAGAADAVLVAASAETTAEAVAALQGKAPTVPVALGPAALAPAFSAKLTELGASGGATTAGQFFTVGTTATDASTDEGVVRFLTAVRVAAQDADLTALTGTETFGRAGAATADVRSHDAVLALAAAAAQAKSVEAGAVLTALRDLDLTAEQGLAGPALSFGQAQALGDDGVSVLQATTRGPGRGVEEGAPALSWFAVPTGTG